MLLLGRGDTYPLPQQQIKESLKCILIKCHKNNINFNCLLSTIKVTFFYL